ncbi:hypothetical protein CEXT_271281 [Caerostris extrusa]|uniref:Uncharacterized protein n=1 Tax=Caerostris extrusa TaxID=172846 RepID=A0AAV4MF71_CAEEX|nr:hypothetical protein CEXT_271281 [Caerostris extrusa]
MDRDKYLTPLFSYLTHFQYCTQLSSYLNHLEFNISLHYSRIFPISNFVSHITVIPHPPRISLLTSLFSYLSIRISFLTPLFSYHTHLKFLYLTSLFSYLTLGQKGTLPSGIIARPLRIVRLKA